MTSLRRTGPRRHYGTFVAMAGVSVGAVVLRGMVGSDTVAHLRSEGDPGLRPVSSSAPSLDRPAAAVALDGADAPAPDLGGAAAGTTAVPSATSSGPVSPAASGSARRGPSPSRSPGSVAGGDPAPDQGSAAGTASAAPRTTKKVKPSASAAAAPPAQTTSSRTVDGAVESTKYGNVQVAVVLTGNQITDVQILQVPDETARDKKINDDAVPKLHDQVLAAQSAQVQGVSGATYTSNGYELSVQSALDQA